MGIPEEIVYERFSVKGSPEEVAKKLSSRCSNATDRGDKRKLDLSHDRTARALEGSISYADFARWDRVGKWNRTEVYVIETTFQGSSLRRNIAESLGYPTILRAVVIGYKREGDGQECSEVIPINSEYRPITKENARELDLELIN